MVCVCVCVCACAYVCVCVGAITESRGWVQPVQANQPLKEALLAYIKPPNSHQKLRTLSEYVSYGNYKPTVLQLYYIQCHAMHSSRNLAQPCGLWVLPLPTFSLPWTQ